VAVAEAEVAAAAEGQMVVDTAAQLVAPSHAFTRLGSFIFYILHHTYIEAPKSTLYFV